MTFISGLQSFLKNICNYPAKPGVGNLFIITGRMNLASSLESCKINFILKFYLYLTFKET